MDRSKLFLREIKKCSRFKMSSLSQQLARIDISYISIPYILSHNGLQASDWQCLKMPRCKSYTQDH